MNWEQREVAYFINELVTHPRFIAVIHFIFPPRLVNGLARWLGGLILRWMAGPPEHFRQPTGSIMVVLPEPYTDYEYPCCACGRHVPGNYYGLLIERKLPAIEGQPLRNMWGCPNCGVNEGAIAMVCEGCLRSNRPVRFAVSAAPGGAGRIPVADLGPVHRHKPEHNPAFDASVARARQN